MFSEYKDRNRLEQEVTFIGGSTQTLVFEILDRFGDPLDLTGSEIKWTLSYVGQSSSPILIKDNKLKGGVQISSQGEFSISLSPSDTEILETGKYEHEPIIIQPNGKVLRPSYGILSIRKGCSYQ